MDNLNYPNNSHKVKDAKNENQSEKKIAPVATTGVVKTKKKGFLRKIFSMFISDEIEDPKSYVIHNIVIPGVKRTFTDAVDVVLNGEFGRRTRKSGNSITEYRGGYSASRYDDRPVRSPNPYEIDDIICENYGDCEAILDEMNDTIERYGMISVSDLHDIIGQPKSGNHTDCKYGWTSLRTARIIHVSGGYMLKLPRVVPLS